MRRLTLRVGTVAALSVAIIQARASARDGPASRGGPPSGHANHSWRVLPGVARVDTLAYPPRDVLSAARIRLEADKWSIYAVDSTRGRVVTKWKTLHYPLLSVFMGKLRARCTVLVEPLGPYRTRMVFRGDLASTRDLRKSPMIGVAKRAYATATRKYQAGVRRYLSRQRRFSYAVR